MKLFTKTVVWLGLGVIFIVIVVSASFGWNFIVARLASLSRMRVLCELSLSTQHSDYSVSRKAGVEMCNNYYSKNAGDIAYCAKLMESSKSSRCLGELSKKDTAYYCDSAHSESAEKRCVSEIIGLSSSDSWRHPGLEKHIKHRSVTIDVGAFFLNTPISVDVYDKSNFAFSGAGPRTSCGEDESQPIRVDTSSDNIAPIYIKSCQHVSGNKVKIDFFLFDYDWMLYPDVLQ